MIRKKLERNVSAIGNEFENVQMWPELTVFIGITGRQSRNNVYAVNHSHHTKSMPKMPSTIIESVQHSTTTRNRT